MARIPTPKVTDLRYWNLVLPAYYRPKPLGPMTREETDLKRLALE